MNIPDIVDRIKLGEKPGGVRVNHQYLLDKNILVTRLISQNVQNICLGCTNLDLLIMYYNLTGREFTGNLSKPAMAKKLIGLAKSSLVSQ